MSFGVNKKKLVKTFSNLNAMKQKRVMPKFIDLTH